MKVRQEHLRKCSITEDEVEVITGDDAVALDGNRDCALQDLRALWWLDLVVDNELFNVSDSNHEKHPLCEYYETRKMWLRQSDYRESWLTFAEIYFAIFFITAPSSSRNAGRFSFS